MAVAKTTATPTIPPESTVGEHVEKQSRPVVDEDRGLTIMTFINNMREVIIADTGEDGMMFSDGYYEPKPDLVTR